MGIGSLYRVKRYGGPVFVGRDKIQETSYKIVIERSFMKQYTRCIVIIALDRPK